MPEDGRSQDERNDAALRIALSNARAERFWAEREAADGRGPESRDSGDGGDGSTWMPVDIAPILAGNGSLEPAPTMLARADGRHLIYRAKVHSYNGEPECGKGWLSLLACAERLDAGEHVAYIDFEDEAAVAITRLRALGVSTTPSASGSTTSARTSRSTTLAGARSSGYSNTRLRSW